MTLKLSGFSRYPARCGRLTTIRPNEPEAAQPRVHDLGQTNPSRSRHAGIAPNEPEAFSSDKHLGQTNLGVSQTGNTVLNQRPTAKDDPVGLTDRTQPEGNCRRARPKTPAPCQRARAILAKRTRALSRCDIGHGGRLRRQSRLACLRWRTRLRSSRILHTLAPQTRSDSLSPFLRGEGGVRGGVQPDRLCPSPAQRYSMATLSPST